MFNTSSQMTSSAPRLTFNPIQTLVKMDQKRRQRQSLRKLDAERLADIGITSEHRDAILRDMRIW